MGLRVSENYLDNERSTHIVNFHLNIEHIINMEKKIWFSALNIFFHTKWSTIRKFIDFASDHNTFIPFKRLKTQHDYKLCVVNNINIIDCYHITAIALQWTPFNSNGCFPLPFIQICSIILCMFHIGIWFIVD